MKIAQVAPLCESVPPKTDNIALRSVSYLTEELVRQGHDVTLFASPDSLTSAELVPCSPLGLGQCAASAETSPQYSALLDKVFSRAEEFDIVHFHIGSLHFPRSRQVQLPHVTTLHGRLDHPDIAAVFLDYCEMPVVSVADAQRDPLPNANWTGTVPYALPKHLYHGQPQGGDHLAFIGRLTPAAGVTEAIAIALAAGKKLSIAGAIPPEHQDYFDRVISPLLGDPRLSYLGEIGGRDKEALLGGASALLLTGDGSEPFDLAMIEALACGTPVIGYRRGAVPEIVIDGITGFIVEERDQAVWAVRKAAELDRKACRVEFDQRYTTARMARAYLKIYNCFAPERAGLRQMPRKLRPPLRPPAALT